MRGTVWLIGMPGAGKSTVGHLLAARLGRPFVDADQEIDRRTGRGMGRMFAKLDMQGFRRIERQILGDLALEGDLVVGCGGGAVLDEHNRAAMRASGTVVFLEVPLDVLRRRLHIPDRARPLLRGERDLSRLLDERAELYRGTAHVTVDGSGAPDEVAGAIERALS